MLHEGGGVVCGGCAFEGVLVDDGDATSVLVGSFTVRDVSIGGCYGDVRCGGGVQLGKTPSGEWVPMVTQSLVACFPSDQELNQDAVELAEGSSVGLAGRCVGRRVVASGVKGFLCVAGEAAASTGQRASVGPWRGVDAVAIVLVSGEFANCLLH